MTPTQRWRDDPLFGGDRLVRIDVLFPASQSIISIAVAFTGGSNGFIAEQYEQILARSQLKTEPRITTGAMANIALLQNKYLPHWMVPHVQRLLAALVVGRAIAFPLFGVAS